MSLHKQDTKIARQMRRDRLMLDFLLYEENGGELPFETWKEITLENEKIDYQLNIKKNI
ncbi:MAG: hypothetical protein WC810_14380 [Janthinobacterium sp.]|jgi:hypothetical protein